MLNEAAYDGGGIDLSAGSLSSAIFRNCIIASNLAGWEGGGIYKSDSGGTLSLTNCTLAENTASKQGGGIYIAGYYRPQSSSERTDNECVEHYSKDGRYGNDIINTILWNDSPDEIYVEWWEHEPDVTYSNVQGGWEGEGNIDADPRFVPFSIYGFEYLLKPGSPCIDSGSPIIPDTIYQWHPRWPDWYIDRLRSDIGAYGGNFNDGWLEWLK